MRAPALQRLIASVGLLMIGCGAEPDGPAAEATLELHACASAAIADAKCGVWTVEENRGEPNGRRIELAIFVAPATSRTPAADPVFLLAGGPGQGAAEVGPRIIHKFDAIRRDRAMVFVDLRGTGAAGPLRCDAEDPEDLAQLLGATFDYDELAACLAGYDGADLQRYTTVDMVEDLDEVRAALGYSQINLLGISYGSRLALEYMRRHGEHTRSVVLDGVVPPDVGVSLAAPANAEAALELMLADCRADAECAAAFPGLERKLAQVLTDLETNRALEEIEHPRTGERMRVEISRSGFVSILRSALYSGHSTSLIPLLIDRAHVGDWGPTAALALQTAKIGKTVSLGLYFSVACSEDLHDLSEATRRAAVDQLEVFDDHMLAHLEEICRRWPHATHEPELFSPVESSVPTLMISGRYDPVTPPSFAERVGASLSNARHVIAGNVSHGVWHQGCTPKLMAEFFANPDPAALEASCLDAVPRSRVFLSPNGPRRGHSAVLEPMVSDSPALAQGELER
ncbi:MAG TPA: alpha/beta hydrolase [Enhygromyxa sp.]|nr:alpha/beta hydrolase [Enhygromyxa sp.]